MGKFSTSITKGEGHLRHNNREIITKNVDQSRTCYNVTYVKETLEEAYEKLFGEEVRRYNEGKKPCRQISNYLEYIQQSKNGEKTFYEIIVQVGNMYDCGIGTKNGEMAKEILDAYMKDFKKRNPNIYVFNAVLHMDEKTPHIHIDYIPIARGYKQGLQIRNSLDKALKQQGIDGKSNKKENSTQNWQEKEKKALAKLLEERGHERAPESGLKRKHRSVENYKSECQIVNAKVKKLPAQIETAPMMLNKERVTVKKTDLEKLEKRAKLATIHNDAMGEAEKLIDVKKQEMDALRREIIAEHKIVHDERIRLEETVQAYEELYDSQREINKAYSDLRDKCSQQENEIYALRTQNAYLSQNINEKVENSVKAKTSALTEQIGTLTADNLKKNLKIGNLENENKGLRSTLQKVKDIAMECFKKRDFSALKQFLFPDDIRKTDRGVRNRDDR